MCGIAGIIDLAADRPVDSSIVHRMAAALIHRGPDDDGFLLAPGVGFAARRLSILGVEDGAQPVYNEDRSVAAVFNGELFDDMATRRHLQQRGHKLRTRCDTELLPHLYEDHGEDFFAQLRGQFAVALFDQRRGRVLLGRDRFGICPLYWTVAANDDGRWLLFASEIKALLASGMVEAQANLHGLNQLFTFISIPGPATSFVGIHYLPPGRFLRVDNAGRDAESHIEEHTFWEIDFPDAGQEDYETSQPQLVDQLEQALLNSVTSRLRADVPVAAYLSGGVDSSTIVAMASQALGRPIPSFTVRIKAPQFDESHEALVTAQHVGVDPVMVDVGPAEVLATYPELIRVAECPVVDTACAALLLLAREVHRRGFKVALTGEGADEWLAGYPWQKVHRIFGMLTKVPGISLSQRARRLVRQLSGLSEVDADYMRRSERTVGGHNAWHDIHNLMSMAKTWFYSDAMRAALADHVPYEDLQMPTSRMGRWHPLNRELAVSARVHLAGLLLNSKGDRVAMNSAVETRYPFLDEEVFDLLAKLPPQWKQPGLTKDKRILRTVAQRWLPQEVAWRRKAQFRAPLDCFHLHDAPAYVDQLLSPESLTRAGYFDPVAVSQWRDRLPQMNRLGLARTAVEMGLAGVLATQLWHHTFVESSLCELPTHKQTMASPRSQLSRGAKAPNQLPQLPVGQV